MDGASSSPTPGPPTLISTTTVLSLLSTVAILSAAYGASILLLPRSATAKTRALFIWHAFDALIHFTLEGGYLYNCFFSYIQISDTPSASPDGGDPAVARTGPFPASPYLPPNVYMLDRPLRIYGAEHGRNALAALWREYAKADRRWGGSDLTVISLELLTVFVGGPLAAYICTRLRKGERGEGQAWFWMIVLATGELYGGFMTFAPEWLSGSPNLVTDVWMYKWLYLVFFNTIWVWIPLWVLWEGYGRVSLALGAAGEGAKAKES